MSTHNVGRREGEIFFSHSCHARTGEESMKLIPDGHSVSLACGIPCHMIVAVAFLASLTRRWTKLCGRSIAG